MSKRRANWHPRQDPDREKRLGAFVEWTDQHIKGDEKGEAQVFLDHLFRAFGQGGVKEAGAELEMRIKKTVGGTAFADLVWKPIVLIEMKKRGADLSRHLRQAFDYWVDLVPNRPKYVVLCNFDEFRIYDFDVDIHEPQDTLLLTDLPKRYSPLAFLFPTREEPIFKVNRLKVTREAADLLAECFNRLAVRSDIGRDHAQRFILQMLVALFSEDINLLPKFFVTELLRDCIDPPKSFDLLGGLFNAMASKHGARGGRFKDIPYFNGGLFEHPAPVELADDERARLIHAAEYDWSHISPDVFGTIFQHSLDEKKRHALGAHYTTPTDIMKIVQPTIVRPWRDAIEHADTLRELAALRHRLFTFRVLDPACGSGNFLYIAYRELKRLEADLIKRMDDVSTARDKSQREFGFVNSKQFFGMDIIPFAVELAKVTMTLAHKLSIDELHIEENPLPLDNLDANIRCVDALIDSQPAGLNGEDQSAWRTPLLDEHEKPVRTNWPAADVIIGNPPFNGAKKLKPDFGPDYVNAVRKAYPDVPGMADYCVFWFRRTHDHLPRCSAGDRFAGRAGLVGTQNIRNNKSREGGLDHVAESGVIVEAVENQPWSGEANVHVSIANWVKLPTSVTPESLTDKQADSLDIPETRRLWTKIDPRLALFDDGEGDGKTRKTTRVTGKRGGTRTDKSYELKLRNVAHINSALSDETDVSGALLLQCNTKPQVSFNGQMLGHDAFLLSKQEADKYLNADPRNADVIYPYLNGREMLSKDVPGPDRYVLDFDHMDQVVASTYILPFSHAQNHVLPARRKKAEQGKTSTGKKRVHHKAFLEYWWRLSFSRPELCDRISSLNRYIACSLVTKRAVFAFVDGTIRPSNLLQIFAFEDDYSFGILQSDIHWQWFVAKCSKLKSDYRFGESVWNTFPWPQSPTKKQVRAVAKAGREVRRVRDEILPTMHGGLRALYRSLELPGKHPLKDAQASLDEVVRQAYGFKRGGDVLGQLLALNLEVANAIARGEAVTAPGVPASYGDPKDLVTKDCIRP